MSGFTSEDFAQATLATRGDYGVARRMSPEARLQWWVYSDVGFLGQQSDEVMADGGWVPVVEADGPVVTEGTLRHVKERAERKRERLIRHVFDLEGTIRRRGAALEDLREKLADAERRAELAEWTQGKIAGEASDLRQEIDRLERILQTPLSLKDLQVAWGAAEVPTGDDPIRGGDVIIYQHDGGQWSVREVEPHEHDDDDWSCSVRILSRAPREPWVELAGVLHDEAPKGVVDVDHLAERLHAAGVRVTGGEEK